MMPASARPQQRWYLSATLGVGGCFIVVGVAMAWSGHSEMHPIASPGGANGSHVLIVENNSGSSNVAPYTFSIYEDGSATLHYDLAKRPGATKTLPEEPVADHAIPVGTLDLTDLRANLAILGSVTKITPNGGCAKSASFGSVTTITYNSATSVDITCPTNNPPGLSGVLADLYDFLNIVTADKTKPLTP